MLFRSGAFGAEHAHLPIPGWMGKAAEYFKDVSSEIANKVADGLDQFASHADAINQMNTSSIADIKNRTKRKHAAARQRFWGVTLNVHGLFPKFTYGIKLGKTRKQFKYHVKLTNPLFR